MRWRAVYAGILGFMGALVLLMGLLLGPFQFATGQEGHMQHGQQPTPSTPPAPAQAPTGDGGHGAPAPLGPGALPGPAGPIRLTEEEMDRLPGGVPPGWRFRLPPGGREEEGRLLFVELECFKCHKVQGEKFPEVGQAGDVGPDLTGVGAHHPAEYLAESVVYPNAVIIEGKGFTGPDGLSKMPSYNDSITVQQWLDLVAYLQSLRTGGAAH